MRRATIAIPLVIGCVIGFSTVACTRKPPLRLKQSNGQAVIDVRTLGEYQTTVTRVRLTDTTVDRVVWEVADESGESQIDEIVLKEGTNGSLEPLKIARGQFDVVVPRPPTSFVLVNQRKYTVEVWGTSPQPTQASFVF